MGTVKDIKNFIDNFLAELENKKIELKNKSASLFSEEEIQIITSDPSSKKSNNS